MGRALAQGLSSTRRVSTTARAWYRFEVTSDLPRHGRALSTATHDADVVRSQSSRWAKIHVVHPREFARVRQVDGSGVVLGREPGRDGVILAHPTVSRRHFAISCGDRDGLWIGEDLGSHNGTWIDGAPAGRTPHVLRDGEVVRLGEVVAVFECGDGTPTDADAVDREAIPGDSNAARVLRTAILRAASERAPALLIGESGTGKEWVARELHRLSGRGTLVVANCAALSATLVESQLFGHERGAFTGAARSHAGLFRSADGGSLVLDEIGELPLELQPKLLRAVELGEIGPLGGNETFKVDVRIIAATNRDLGAEVEAGRFRRDLYARLSVVVLRTPPLRARRPDLLPWIDRLHRRWSLARHAAEPESLQFTAEAVETLLLHRWPENLRGLDHVVHELAGLREAPRVTRADLANILPKAVEAARETEQDEATPTPRRDKPERAELLAVLEELKWNIAAVGRYYGRHRRQVYRWLGELGIEPQRDPER